AVDQIGYVAPRTPAEEVIAAIWAEVLRVEKVGIHDNFFELGGDSIKSVMIIYKARHKGLALSLQDLFRHQTISKLVSTLLPAETTAEDPATVDAFSLVAPGDHSRLPETIEDAYPLSQLQAGMLYHMQLTPDAPDYHNVNSYFLRGVLDVECFQAAVDYVVARHPVLRTSFDFIHYSEPLQLVHKTATLEVKSKDISTVTTSEQEDIISAFVEKEARHPFDLTSPSLLRLYLYRRSEDTFELTITECHAILDGWSLHLILSEIFGSYFKLIDGQSLPPVTSPSSKYRDFIALERKALESSESQHFWANQLRDVEPIRLPRRHDHPANSHHTRYNVPVSSELTVALDGVAHTAAVPLKSVLLAVHLRVMALLSNRLDIVTGLVSHGRLEEAEGDKACGLFLNTLPFRLQLDAGSWHDLIQATFKAECQILPHRRFPFATMLQRQSEEPFETAFNFVNFHVLNQVLESERIEIKRFIGSEPHNFPLQTTFYVDPGSSRLRFIISYRNADLSAEQVQAIGGYYLTAMQAIANNPDERHEDAVLVSAAERQRLVVDWNATGSA
ncbi:condensation domain-containing protein, partial [Rhizobium leguminosarum]|uniref:condensation domain-containing protein n=1 Tax=Rhizobium leguminosarum TaxID=384 RepID=UPI003F99DC68